jgi:Fe-Mn family superoxide dismutase
MEHSSRRDFLGKALGIAALAAGSSSGIAHAEQLLVSPAGTLTQHTLPLLPYAYSDLEPYIDTQTMTLHHSKHHQAYVDGLNKAESELAKARDTGDFSLIQHWSRQCAFHGGGHALHTLFWNCMAKPGTAGVGTEPDGAFGQKLRDEFGSFDLFRRQFAAAAQAVEGSGWAILHYRTSDSRLIILQAENQQKMSQWNTIPLLALDVWEHAYYLKYQNKRADYINAWWNVVNWPGIAASYGTITSHSR